MNEHWLYIMSTSQNETCMEVQVIINLVPLQRPWEGPRLHRSITGPPTLSASLPLTANWCQSLQVFRSIACIGIFNIVPLPFLSLMDNLVIACKGVGHTENLASMLCVSSSTISL